MEASDLVFGLEVELGLGQGQGTALGNSTRL